MKGWEELEIPEKTYRPAASSGTSPTRGSEKAAERRRGIHVNKEAVYQTQVYYVPRGPEGRLKEQLEVSKCKDRRAGERQKRSINKEMMEEKSFGGWEMEVLAEIGDHTLWVEYEGGALGTPCEPSIVMQKRIVGNPRWPRKKKIGGKKENAEGKTGNSDVWHHPIWRWGHLLISARMPGVAERLARSPPTKANRAQYPAGPPYFRKWESCRRMPLLGGDLPFPPPLHPGAAPYSLQSPLSALKISLFRITPLHSLYRSP
ncbi:hypothetical protein PR048_028428 [Dryococelus australis]|uniref:Uncharacterized protein n=1 Tax=Dryococelus australis TaxID=614101 RepID=A0ABQ9GAJ4_9NEOP|nr:hypothetical protein PR048_028428 [Dryococelus australis]